MRCHHLKPGGYAGVDISRVLHQLWDASSSCQVHNSLCRSKKLLAFGLLIGGSYLVIQEPDLITPTALNLAYARVSTDAAKA